MQTLLITDLHLNSRIPDLLDVQVECVLKIFYDEMPDEVIIMGDVFMYRKPTPSELIGFKKIITCMKSSAKVAVIRGNHDSETKADDGRTALLLYEDDNVNIVTHTYVDYKRKRVFIPHYENEETIIKDLEMVPTGYTVFGHFGYDGCLNSAGDADFGISLSNFSNRTFLGHIHGFCERQGGLPDSHSTVTCLGTPYTTNYGEAFKENFYALLSGTRWDNHCLAIKYKQPTTGPRHLVYSAKEVENNLDIINDPNYFTFLRIMVQADHYSIPYDKLKVAYVDIKYAPVFNEEDISSYSADRDLFSINDVIISDYIKEANSTIATDKLMEGYRLLQDEN